MQGTAAMVFKPNYNFQKAERVKAKQARKEEKAREKEQRKTEGGPESEPAIAVEESAAERPDATA